MKTAVLLFACVSTIHGAFVCVVPHKEQVIHNRNCDYIGDLDECLKNFSDVAYHDPDVVVYFVKGTHLLVSNSSFTVVNYTSISLIGEVMIENTASLLPSQSSSFPSANSNNYSSVIDCQGFSRFVFSDLVSLFITNLTFVNCGTKDSSDVASILIKNINNASIEDVSIKDCPGSGIVGASVWGLIRIQRSCFVNVVGSALSVVDSNIEVMFSVFKNCSAACWFRTSEADPDIKMALVSDSSFWFVKIAARVSGMYIDMHRCEFHEVSTAITLDEVDKATIRYGSFNHVTCGIRATDASIMVVQHTTFARLSAAIIVRSTVQHVGNVFIENCTFDEVKVGINNTNTDKLSISGSTFDNTLNAYPNVTFDIIASQTQFVTVNYSDFNMSSSAVTLLNVKTSEVKWSTFVGNMYAGLFDGGSTGITDCNFSNFTNSAIVAVSSNLSISGCTRFSHGKSADNGGALYLWNSLLYFVAPANVHFFKNVAVLSGGAIYTINVSPVDLSYLYATRSCFFQIIDLNGTIANPGVSLSFENNVAGESGNSVYGSLKCNLDYSILSNDFERATPRDVLQAISNLKVIDSDQFAADPQDVCYVKSDTREIRCPFQVDGEFSDSITVTLYPGQHRTQSFLSVDEFNGTTPSVVYVQFQNYTVLDVFRTHKSAFDYSIHSTMGNVTLMFLTADEVLQNPFSESRKQLFVHVYVIPCPQGFALDDNTKACVCNQFLNNQINVTCNITDLSIYSSLPSWVGTNSNGDLAFYLNCPVNFCIETQYVTLDMQDSQCRYRRHGVLCGECAANLSEAFGSSVCLECSNTYLILIVPFAVMGIGLVAFLLLLNLNVSNSALSAFIYYSNILKANSSYLFPQDTTKSILKVFTALISWFNLDLGITTCFYDGMTQSVKVGLQFVFPAYILALVGGIILASKYSTRLSKLCRHNVVPLLATLVLLSYTKLLNTVITIFSFVRLSVESASSANFMSYETVWLCDGNMPYLKGNHVYLFIAGILVTTFFILPYTLLLVSSPWLTKISDWKVFHWVNRLKPFIDCYEAPYIPRHRFWTGALLVARIIIYITSTANFPSAYSVNATVTVLVTLCLMLYISRFTVYRDFRFTLVEMFLYVNLILICIFRMMFDSLYDSVERSEVPIEAVFGLGVVSALALSFSLLGWRVYTQIMRINRALRPTPMQQDYSDYFEFYRPIHIEQTIPSSSEVSDDGEQYREELLFLQSK